MDDFTRDDLIELYMLLDISTFNFQEEIDSGELDADSKDDILSSIKTYDRIKHKIENKLKQYDVKIERKGIVE